MTQAFDQPSGGKHGFPTPDLAIPELHDHYGVGCSCTDGQHRVVFWLFNVYATVDLPRPELTTELLRRLNTQPKLYAALEVAIKACSCRGTGTRSTSCTLCGDSQEGTVSNCCRTDCYDLEDDVDRYMVENMAVMHRVVELLIEDAAKYPDWTQADLAEFIFGAGLRHGWMASKGEREPLSLKPSERSSS
jgi:hypothetical protein